MGKGIVDGVACSTTVAYDFALFYERREEDRWALADICAVLSHNPTSLHHLVVNLANQFGISVTLQTLKNYARVSKSFGERDSHNEYKHRHLQYKWSNYLAWSKWENPIEAMEQALDCGYSPRQMDNLRKHGDPNYKKPKPELCQVCGGDVLARCDHALTGYSDDGLLDPGKSVAEQSGMKPGDTIEIDYGPELRPREDDEGKD